MASKAVKPPPKAKNSRHPPQMSLVEKLLALEGAIMARGCHDNKVHQMFEKIKEHARLLEHGPDQTGAYK